MNSLFKYIIFVALLLQLPTLYSCTFEEPKELIFYDFETDVELDQIHWKCFTMFELSEKYATHGKKSQKMELNY